MNNQGFKEVKSTVWLWTTVGAIVGGILGTIIMSVVFGGTQSPTARLAVYMLGLILSGGAIAFKAYKDSVKNAGGPPSWLWKSKKGMAQKDTSKPVAKVQDTSVEPSKFDSTDDSNDDKGKNDKFWLIVEPLVFAFNCYVIVNNLAVGDGYLWVGLSLIVNISIALTYKSVFAKVIPKINSHVSYGVLIVALIMGVSFSMSVYENNLEKSAQNLVTEILEENIGKGEAAECKRVKIGEEISSGLYRAEAILSNGNTLNIVVEEKENNMIEVRIPQYQ